MRFWDSLFQLTWYVHVGETLENASFTTSYIGRYTKRPVIAESRIKEYDGETVTFEYQDKKERIYQQSRIPVLEFIGLLVRHIPEKGFRMIRYSGIFANRTRGRDIPLARIALKLREGTIIESLTWRQRRTMQNKIDPLVCQKCGKEMILVEVAFRSRDGPLRVWQFDKERVGI